MRRFHMALSAVAGGAAGVSLPATITVADEVSGGPALAGITFADDGTYSSAGSVPASGDWYAPSAPGLGSLYEIRFAPSSGSVSSGTINTWLAFPQTWQRNRLAVGVSDVAGTLEIRLTSSGVVQASTTLTLTAERV